MPRLGSRGKSAKPEIALGKIIHGERVRMGYKQTEFAERIGRNQSWMSKLERGEIPLASLSEDDIAVICYELRIPEKRVFKATGRRISLEAFDGRRVYLGGLPELYLYFANMHGLDFIAHGDNVYAISHSPARQEGDRCFIDNLGFEVDPSDTHVYGESTNLLGLFEVVEINWLNGHLVKPLGQNGPLFRVWPVLCRKVTAEFWLKGFEAFGGLANLESSQRIGALVKERRLALGLTQRHVASASGRSQTWVNYLENGEASLQQLPYHSFRGLLRSVGLDLADVEALGIPYLMLDLGSVDSSSSVAFLRFDSYLQNLVGVETVFKGPEVSVFEKAAPALGDHVLWQGDIWLVDNLLREKVVLRHPDGPTKTMSLQRLPVLVVRGYLWDLQELNLSFDS